MNISRHLLILTLTGAIASLAGCAQQVGDIDRTQPNKIEKAVFNDGAEWYVRSTIVDVPGTAVTSFAGLQGEMNRVRWEITADHLIAYRTNEDVIGIDTHNPNEVADGRTSEDGEFRGAPMAAFGVSHFDVQRAYSSSTGEQSNVITENYSDRPWYEREFLRVNWGYNSAPLDRGFDPAVSLQRFAGLQIAPQDSGLTPEDVTWRVETNETGEVDYIDVLNTYVFEPDWLECVLTFGFPMYGGDCGPEVIKVRTSFMKIDLEEDGQHEPRIYDDHELDKFGFFRTERCVYDRTYGCRDSSTVKIANIWRIWKDARDADGNFKPYSERTPRPIAYYLSANYPDDLVPESELIADQWDKSMSDVVKHYHPNFTGRMFYLCSNPGTADEAGYAAGVCKQPGVVKEPGDLRYSFFNWVDNDQQVGPLGYGPSSADPLTGELINGNANIYGAAIDRYAQYVLDILMLTTGDLDPEAFAAGRNVINFIENQEKEGVFFGYETTRKARAESLQNVKEKLSRREGKIFDVVDQLKGKTLQQRLELLQPYNNKQKAVWPKLRGSEIERMMVNDDIKVGFGRGLVGPGDYVDLDDEEVADMLSPAKIGTMARVRGEYDRNVDRFASRNMMMMEFFDGSYLGVAQELKAEMATINEDINNDGTIDNFDKLEHARRILRKRIYKGVMEHEVGHTVGLRHNFEGSFDAVNYKPEYWALRFIDYDNDGQVDPINPAIEHNPAVYANQVASDENLNGDERTARISEITNHINGALRDQLANKMREFQLSSIMDYGAKLNSDFHGIGSYDYAAIKYAYGNLVEVFNVTPTKIAIDYGNSNFDSAEATEVPITDWEDLDIVSGALAPDEVTVYVDTDSDYFLDNNLDFYHYSLLPLFFGGSDGDMSKMYDRSTMTRDEMLESGKLEVPYRFCSDEYRGGTPSCDVWDEGASFEEILDTHIQGYKDYYIFNNFRRDRSGWGLYIWPLFQRFVGRYFGPMANIYQHWVLRLFYNDDAWYRSEWGGQLGWASIERALGTMMQTLITPNVGTYGYDIDKDEYVNISSQEGFRFRPGENTKGYVDLIDVGVGVGKYDRSRYEYDSGYYYFLRYEVLTSFYERWAAMIALTNAETNFIGVDGASDITAFSIPVTLLYSEELYRWFGALITGDMKEIAPLIEVDQNEEMGTSARALKGVIRHQNPLGNNFLRATYENRLKLNPFSNERDFNMELFSMAYGLGMFQDRFDRTFNALANVMILGRGETYTVVPGFETIEWTDPTTGKTYLSAKTQFSDKRDIYPTGYKMIERAVELEEAWRLEACGPDHVGDDLDDCDTRNSSEYFQMTSHRENLDTLVITNNLFDNWNDMTWVITQ